MRPCDLTAADVALFARKVLDAAEYEELSDLEKQECEGALAAAKAAAAGYTGLDVETSTLADLSYAIKVLAAEMIDNHQDRKSTRLNSSHIEESRMPSSA